MYSNRQITVAAQTRNIVVNESPAMWRRISRRGGRRRLTRSTTSRSRNSSPEATSVLSLKVSKSPLLSVSLPWSFGVLVPSVFWLLFIPLSCFSLFDDWLLLLSPSHILLWFNFPFMLAWARRISNQNQPAKHAPGSRLKVYIFLPPPSTPTRMWMTMTSTDRHRADTCEHHKTYD